MIEMVSPFDGEKLPDPEKYSGIILTGSHGTIMKKEDWSERTAEWIPKVLEKEIPLLGICYGHQLIAYAMGGKVNDNPLGKEFGTVETILSDYAKNDPLFKNLPSKMLVQVCHSQSVLTLPDKAVILSSSKRDPFHAFFLPPSTWGVQFHPEFSAAIVLGYVKHFATELQDEGYDVDEMILNIVETSESEKILGQFGELIFGK